MFIDGDVVKKTIFYGFRLLSYRTEVHRLCVAAEVAGRPCVVLDRHIPSHFKKLISCGFPRQSVCPFTAVNRLSYSRMAQRILAEADRGLSLTS